MVYIPKLAGQILFSFPFFSSSPIASHTQLHLMNPIISNLFSFLPSTPQGILLWVLVAALGGWIEQMLHHFLAVDTLRGKAALALGVFTVKMLASFLVNSVCAVFEVFVVRPHD